MLNQAHSWPCDTGRVDLRLALGSPPMYFISPLPTICQKIQSSPLRAPENGFFVRSKYRRRGSTATESPLPINSVCTDERPTFTENYFLLIELSSVFWSPTDSPVKSTFHIKS